LTLKPLDILKSSFGYDEFRPIQEDAIDMILNGIDTFVLMPTGGGKSICFQVPALVLDGLTIVISPLISLMQDQVETLKGNGIRAAFFNSTQSGGERNDLARQAMSGELKLLYMAPETFLPAVQSWLTSVNVSLIAIDEAHCVSTWGHDFRPEYTQLGQIRSSFPNVPFMALTATADVLTRKDIITQLRLHQPEVYISSFDRPNLELTVKGNIPKKQKFKQILEFIKAQGDASGIIYCFSRKETEEWANELKRNGMNAEHYHAGMPSQKRASVQQSFINDDTPIICATIAFGMGIDKSNVRWVIHNNLPKNVESYYQEIGRAGRDGLPSQVLLYYTMKDVVMQSNFIRQDENSIVGIKKLQRMQQFAEATSCRRKILLNYFNEHREQDCGNCDICLNPPDFIDGTVIAQKALSGIHRTNQRAATTMLIKILRGSESQDVINRGFDKIKTFGVGAEYTEYEWQHYLAQLINLGLIEIAYDQYLSLKYTATGKQVLFGAKEIKLTIPPEKTGSAKKEKKKKKSKAQKLAAGTYDEGLFEVLRIKRAELAKEQRVPPYIIFNDVTLTQMAGKKPASLNEMATISGVGDTKLVKYGPIFLDLILRSL
jgi:ATP-dependent DNA helicase RecQ